MTQPKAHHSHSRTQAPLDRVQDQKARDLIRDSLDESLLVEAAAGTGKTTMLVARLVSVLKTGRAKVNRIVAVTFTRKAAGELKLRLRQSLEEERRQTESRPQRINLEQAVASLEEARIGTIHSFCAELLRERPVEAGVDPDFQELSEEEAPRLFDEVFQKWIQVKLNEAPEVVNRTLMRVSQWRSYPPISPLVRLRDTAWNLSEWRDFRRPWTRRPFDREAEVDNLVEQVVVVAKASSRCPYRQDYLRKSLQPARFLARSILKSEEIRPRDYDDLEARLVQLFRALKRDSRKGKGRFAEGISRRQMLDAREQLIEQLEGFKMRSEADLAACLQSEFRPLTEEYELLKQRSGSLDFVDLLIRTRDLLRRDSGVRAHLQRRFSHIFVDEFQDTDPLQAEILILLSAEDPEQSDWNRVKVTPGKLFLVGDPKQSIYRFRRADVLLYQQVKQKLEPAGVKVVFLGQNFRSVQSLQEAVNASFSKAMLGDELSGQPDYVPLLEHRGSDARRPSLIALPIPDPYGWYNISKKRVEEEQPEVIAAFIDWMLNESGWTVGDPEDPRAETPILPRHICILFRRFMSWNQDVTRPYVRSLENRRIPHLLVGSRTFHQREEVETLRAALTAVEWPDDELAVFATLRGSLFSIPDNVLLRFRLENQWLHPFQEPPAKTDADYGPIVEGLALMRRLHEKRNERPLVETVGELLNFTRAHAGFAMRPSGDQVLANVQKICDLARSYEMGSGISFRGFVERLREEADRPRSTESPLIEEGAEGVRIMTLHAAKGLEAPVVVLADVTARLFSQNPDKYVDLEKGLCATQLLGCAPWELHENAEVERKRDEAEGVRIAYVAATRARDILVVPVVGDQPVEGWVSPLHDGLYPADQKKRSSQPAPGCPAFGESSVLKRPSKYDGLGDFSVKPGLHQPREGKHEVVWWDPVLLVPRGEPDFGLRQHELLQADEGGAAAAASMESYQHWKEQRALALKKGGTPSFQPFPVVEAKEPPPDYQPRIEYQQLEVAVGRPSGTRFGILVHTVLRDVDLGAGLETVKELTRFQGRMLEASNREIEAAGRAVAAALQHPLMLQARESPDCRKELPLSCPLDDGRIVEGVIDLAFRRQDGWAIIDFKTDAKLEANRLKYHLQLAWYAYSLEKITQKPVHAYLLGV